MRRKYLSLLLAAAIALTQIAGTGLTVQASEVSEGIGQEAGKASGEMRDDVSEEIGQEPEAGTSEGAGELSGTSEGTEQLPAEGTGQPSGTVEGTEPAEGAGQQPEAEGTGQPSEGAQPPAETEQGEYRPEFNLPDEYRLASGSNMSIFRVGSGYWFSENGSTKEMELTDVVSADPEIAAIEEDEAIDGWLLTAKGLGETTVTVTGADLTDVSGDNASPIRTAEKEIRVIVSDKTYSLQVKGVPQNVHPGADVSLTAEVSAWGSDGPVPDVSDVVVSWTANSDYEGFSEKSGTGNSFQLHVPEGSDTSYWIQVVTEVKRGEEVVASWYSNIMVTNLYYQLDTGASAELEEMWPGETKTITPVLYRYETGKEPVPEPTAKFQFTYDESSVEIKKDGAAVEQNTPQGSGSFTIKRQRNSMDWIQVYAYLGEQQQGHGTIQLQWKRYGDAAILGGMNEFRANLFVDDDNPEENDTEKVFSLDTSKLGGTYEVEWLLESNEGLAVDSGVYAVSGEKGEKIAIDAKALRDDLKAKLEGENESGDYYSNLYAVVKAGGEEQTRISLGINIMKPFYSIDDGDYEVLKSTVFTYKDGKIEGYAQNKEYPYGEETKFELKEVKVLEQEPKTANTNVFTVKKNGNDILLAAENIGRATIEYRIALPSGKERTFTSIKSVIAERYEFSMFSSTGSSNLLPGAELKMETEVWHEFYHEQTGTKKWEKLEPGKYTIEYTSYDEDVIAVAADGTVKAVGESGTGYMEAKCTIPLSEENYVDYAEEEISVSDSYDQAVAKEIFAAPGETINSLGLEWKTFDLEHKNGVAVPGNFSYYLFGNRGITVNEAKTGFTVNSDAAEGKKIRIRVRLEKENSEGMKDYAIGTVTVNVCNHNYVQKSLKPATCTEPGTKVLECSKCHAVTKTETIPAAGHKTGDWTTVKAATCTEAGSQQQKCSVCGKVMNTKDLPQTGHSFGAWTVTAKPTALQQGTETRTCKNCKAAETRKTNKLKATIKLNVKKIPLQVKKSTTAVKVVSMTEGDGVKSWKSSNKKVATVTSKGKITGKKAGNAKITVTLKSGISASVTVKVQKKAVTTTKLTVTGKSVKKNKLTLKKGKKVTLTAVRTPVTSTEKITYKSSNKKIATVTAKGKVTGKKPGKAKITVKSGKKKVTITVTVKK